MSNTPRSRIRTAFDLADFAARMVEAKFRQKHPAPATTKFALRSTSGGATRGPTIPDASSRCLADEAAHAFASTDHIDRAR